MPAPCKQAKLDMNISDRPDSARASHAFEKTNADGANVKQVAARKCDCRHSDAFFVACKFHV